MLEQHLVLQLDILQPNSTSSDPLFSPPVYSCSLMYLLPTIPPSPLKSCSFSFPHLLHQPTTHKFLQVISLFPKSTPLLPLFPSTAIPLYLVLLFTILSYQFLESYSSLINFQALSLSPYFPPVHTCYLPINPSSIVSINWWLMLV